MYRNVPFFISQILFDSFGRVCRGKRMLQTDRLQIIDRKLHTLNLKSPTGGNAYGIPRKFATRWSRALLLHLPRMTPHFVWTVGSDPLSKPSTRMRQSTRTYVHHQILSPMQWHAVDVTHLRCSIFGSDECDCTSHARITHTD